MMVPLAVIAIFAREDTPSPRTHTPITHVLVGALLAVWLFQCARFAHMLDVSTVAAGGDAKVHTPSPTKVYTPSPTSVSAAAAMELSYAELPGLGRPLKTDDGKEECVADSSWQGLACVAAVFTAFTHKLAQGQEEARW